MNTVEEYLSQFEDFELAFFWKYKLDTYMEETQKAIQVYLKKRRLNDKDMKILIEEYSRKKIPNDEFRCIRCKSKKIITKKEKAFNSMDGYELAEELIDYEGIATGKINYICSVCGLEFTPSKASSLMKKVFVSILGFLLNSWKWPG